MKVQATNLPCYHQPMVTKLTAEKRRVKDDAIEPELPAPTREAGCLIKRRSFILGGRFIMVRAPAVLTPDEAYVASLELDALWDDVENFVRAQLVQRGLGNLDLKVESSRRSSGPR